MFNKCILIGRIGRDPESLFTKSGHHKSSFSIATTEYIKDAQGGSTEKTTWINCESWGKVADFVTEYLGKGDLVMVEGRLAVDKWNDQATGMNKTRVYVNVLTLKSLQNPAQKQQGGDEDKKAETDMPF